MKLFGDTSDVGLSKTMLLGWQHIFTMFGATILVPILTGMSVSVALFMAGVGTLLFHLLTKGKVPVFLGSSFAFIGATATASTLYGPEYALGGIVVAGLIYIIFAILVKFFGTEKIISFFPPIVAGPTIMVIGLGLASTAIQNAADCWLMAIVAFFIVVGVSVLGKGFIKAIPILIGLTVSYVIALLLTQTGHIALVDLTPIKDAAWFGLPNFTMAKFNLGAIMLIAPVALCTVVEHIGDVLAVGAICNKDFVKDPGLVRTLLGDGLATSLSAFFGGPANTTYSENTGVLALTKQYNPGIMRIAAIGAILMGLIPKVGAAISTIPISIIGGISIVLFGLIASVGLRTVVDNKIDFGETRNLIIAAVILVLGIGNAVLPLAIGTLNFELSGMALAAIVGIILNKILPKKEIV